MLVLTRRNGESIVIGNDIVVSVLEVRGDQVRIGVDAPRSVPVHREEVFRAVAEENARAVESKQARARLLQQRRPSGGSSRPAEDPGPRDGGA